MEQIRSRKNQYILHLRALARDKDVRRDAGEYVCDGEKLLREALQFGAEVTSVLWREAAAFSLPDGIAQYAADAELVEYASPLMHSPGPVFTVRIPAMCLPEPLRRVIVLEGVQDPGNVGTVIRTANALGMDAVLLTPGCSDPFYRRAIRVAMGTVFQIPWTYVDEDWPELLKINGFSTVAMALCPDSRALNDPEIATQERLAIVLGTEGDGLAVSTIAACDYTVRIPMAHGVDSLNVAAASAVAFYQLGMLP